MMMKAGHAFAGNPLLAEKRDHLSSENLLRLIGEASYLGRGGVWPFLDGKALVAAKSVNPQSQTPTASWKPAWQPLQKFGFNVQKLPEGPNLLVDEASDKPLSSSSSPVTGDVFATPVESLIYIGESKKNPYFAVELGALDFTTSQGLTAAGAQALGEFFLSPDGGRGLGFVDARTLMAASDYSNKEDMENLAIMGHARALMEWHKQSKHCGRCGSPTASIEGGQRRQCTKEGCQAKLYPRTDPVVIMLVIDAANDRVLLGRQSRFVQRMWSCLAGFLEPGESFEEAVRRETREEAGIDVGEVVYHSSQPWPVGAGSMSCQLMAGFFAYATSFDITVDKSELEEARWHTRAEVRQVLENREHEAMRISSLEKIASACSEGHESQEERIGERGSRRGREESSAPWFPGPYAIAHHLIKKWAMEGLEGLRSRV